MIQTRTRRGGSARASARRRAAGRRYRRRTVDHARRRRLAGLLLAVALSGVLAVLTLRTGGSGGSAPALAQPNPAELAIDGPPTLQVLATSGQLQLDVPVRQTRITAIVYHGVGDASALPLQPVGRQRNAGFLSRLVERFFGSSSGSGPAYYVDDSGAGSDTSSVDVGAPAGTDVWAPVDGTIASVGPYVLDGATFGSVIGIRPLASPSTLVTVTNVRPRRDIAVGTEVSAASTMLGTIVDLSGVIHQDVARFTSDAGNHVHLEVTQAPAASPVL